MFQQRSDDDDVLSVENVYNILNVQLADGFH